MAIELLQRTFTSMPSIIFGGMKAANEAHQPPAMRPTTPADLQTEMSEEEGSEMVSRARVSPSDQQPYSA